MSDQFNLLAGAQKAVQRAIVGTELFSLIKLHSLLWTGRNVLLRLAQRAP